MLNVAVISQRQSKYNSSGFSDFLVVFTEKARVSFIGAP